MYSITNNTKITIRNTRTTQVTTILKTDLTAEDRVTGKVVAGIPFIDTIDDSSDSFVVQLKNLSQRDLFKPFDFVVFTVDDGFEPIVKQYFVLFDDVKTYSQMQNTYEHNLSLIEPTKILEKIKIFNLNLTNQSNTFMEQINRALRNAEPVFYNLNSDGTRLYEKECRLYSRLGAFAMNKASRDFYFSNTDLRSVLDEMLGAYNARVTVESVTYDGITGDINSIGIGYRDATKITKATPVWTKEEQGEIIFEHAQNDGQNHAGTVLSRGYNSIAEEPISFTDMFKSENATVSDTSACAMFPFPISSKGIKHFYINTTARFIDKIDSNTVKYTITPLSVDIAPYIIRTEAFDLLDAEEQKTYLSYSVAEKKVLVGRTYKAFMGLLSKPIIKDLIEKEAQKLIPYGQLYDRLDTDYLDLTFTCVYYPIIDTVASISKPNIYDNDDLQMGIMDFQTEQTLDLDRHGRKLAGLIKRTGNAEYYLDVKAKYYSKLLPLMSKIDLPDADSEEEQGFVLYKREYAIYDNFINCRYYFSKDYNAVQQNAGVNRTKHIYDIPLESDETPIMVKKYLVFSKVQDGGGGFDTSLPVAALNTLIGKNESTIYTVGGTTKMAGGKLKYMLFQSQGVKNYPQNTENSKGEFEYTDLAYRFARPICTYALNKTMTFTANCLDNYSVDYSRDGYRFSIWGDAGNMVTYNRYVDNDAGTIGEAKKFELDFAFEWKYSGEERTADATTSVANFPVANNTDFVTCGLTSAPLTVEYYKDRTQTPLFVFALECIPRKDDYGKIIIGTEFAKKNNLVRDNGAGLTGLKLYTSQTLTFDGEENVLSDEYKQNSEQHDVGSFFVVEAYSYDGDSGSGSGAKLRNTTAKTCASWAIADEHGNILLAVNGSVCDIYAGISNFPYVKQ